ncbi:MAG TPA: hypothetical protein VHM26_11155 [Chitinophagaceae bacterium]|jgi:hypothetical protein|nr:hypothetical protein [Chitinophagaceae bacterium]
MKQLHTITLFFSLAITLTATAQVNKGAIFLGGNLGFGTAKTDYGSSSNAMKSNSVTISPAFGIAVKNNLVVGIMGNFLSSTIKETNTPTPAKNTTRMYGGYFFVRKYKAIGKSGFSLFAQGNVGGSYTKGESENQPLGYGQEIKITSAGVSVAPGISFAVSRKLQLETGFNNALSFTYASQKAINYQVNMPVSSQKTRGFEMSTSLNSFTSSFYLGFRLLLNKS